MAGTMARGSTPKILEARRAHPAQDGRPNAAGRFGTMALPDTPHAFDFAKKPLQSLASARGGGILGTAFLQLKGNWKRVSSPLWRLPMVWC
jgi:hypothetical protein